jgi:hypothetical protein
LIVTEILARIHFEAQSQLDCYRKLGLPAFWGTIVIQ